jgi:hypothetical protein
MGYKYLIRLSLVTISHLFFLSRLGFTFLALHLQSMEDKRGTKRARSPSKEGSPSPSGAKTPPPAPSGSPPPLKSPPEVSSRCPHSLMFEQGGSSRKAPVVDLSSSSDEEGLNADTSRDEEFARRLFGDLNRDFLGPPGDDKIIILSDSDEEEEEVRKERTVDAEDVPSFAARSPAPIASADDTDDINKGDTPDRVTDGSSSGGDEIGLPSAITPRWRLQGGVLQGELQGLCTITPQIILQRRVVMMMQNH